MRSYSIEGIVIKRFNLGEANRLITLFTKDHGKITVLAKSVRKPTSKRAGVLELFNHLKASVIKGRGELDTLAEVQILSSFPSWRKYLGRVTLAYQLAEVVDKLTPDRESPPEIFEILKESFSKIGSFGIDWQLKIKNLKLKILVELGYWPKAKEFIGEVDQFVESLINRPLNSPKLLTKLRDKN